MNPNDIKKLQKALPVLPGILGRAEYFNSAVLVLLVLIDKEYHFIFQKRCPTIRQGGEISFPGGEFNPLEDTGLQKTAIRETVEEMGICEDKITIIGNLDTFLAPLGAVIQAFVGIAKISSLDEIQINKDEVEYAFTVPVAYFEENEPERYQALIKIHPSYTDAQGHEHTLFPAKELGIPERYSKPWGNHKYNLYVYKVNNEVIWGITARFIHDLVNKLKIDQEFNPSAISR